MAFEQKEGQGALFKNDRKAQPNQPDYTGNALVGGVTMRVAAWIKEGKKGKFMSLSIQPEGDKPKRDSGRAEDIESDIPF